jgi:hypothetical protein
VYMTLHSTMLMQILSCCHRWAHQLLAVVMELPRLGGHLMVLRLQGAKEVQRLIHLHMCANSRCIIRWRLRAASVSSSICRCQQAAFATGL